MREQRELDHVMTTTKMGTRWGFLPWPETHSEPIYKTVPRKTVELQSQDVTVCCDGYLRTSGVCIRESALYHFDPVVLIASFMWQHTVPEAVPGTAFVPLHSSASVSPAGRE